ncbi:hypothetical protein GN956_G16022 [Arapaima gigas]
MLAPASFQQTEPPSMNVKSKMPDCSVFVPPVLEGPRDDTALANYTKHVVASKPFEDLSSSIVALAVVLTLACAVLVTSLVTFWYHKSQLRDRKLQRAQREYERDGGNGGSGSSGSATLSVA